LLGCFAMNASDGATNASRARTAVVLRNGFMVSMLRLGGLEALFAKRLMIAGGARRLG
jgi:hypothetical protein